MHLVLVAKIQNHFPPNPMILMMRQRWQTRPPVCSGWPNKMLTLCSAISSYTQLAHCWVQLNIKFKRFPLADPTKWCPASVHESTWRRKCLHFLLDPACLHIGEGEGGRCRKNCPCPPHTRPRVTQAFAGYLDSTCHQLFQSSNCQDGIDTCDVESNGPAVSQRRSTISKYLFVTLYEFICRINSHA